MNTLYVLRFLATVLVYMHHLYYPYGFGAICVTFFFIMSGFSVATSIVKKDFMEKRFTRRYYLGKLKKIYPLYILTFVLSIPIMDFLDVKYNLFECLINLLMIQSYFPNENVVFYFNGLTWFVADIMLFYLLSPLVLRLMKKMRIISNIKKISLLLIFIYAISFFISYCFKGRMESYSFGWWFIYISPYYRVFDYFIGFLVGLIFVEYRNNGYGNIRGGGVFSALELFVCVGLYAFYKSPILMIDSLRMGTFYTPILVCMTFVFAIGKGLISKFISINLFIYLGKMSFNIYMIHQLVIYYVSMLLGNSMYYNNQMVYNNYYAQVLVFLFIICMGDVINRYNNSWLSGLKAMKKIGGELTQCLKLSSVKNKGE